MKITLSHGNGGMETAELIESIFLKHFSNEYTSMEDAAVLPFNIGGQDVRVDNSRDERPARDAWASSLQIKGPTLAFTTDSFVVKPLSFPGGDIGRLAVCGTVNDLLTTGGQPLYLSASFILEENLDCDILDSIVMSMAAAAKEAGVYIVTGDTKVIEGNGGLYINTAGVGVAGATRTSDVTDSDAIIVSGTLGDHHACIMSSRMGIRNNIKSDVAPLTGMVSDLIKNDIPIHGLRDITRGGLATVLCEITKTTGLRADIFETDLPVSEEVNGLCRILGLDPLYMGNEGKMLVIIPKEFATEACNIIKRCSYGENAAVIGGFSEGSGVVLNTKIGGQRKLSTLFGEGLPRIC